MEGFKMLINSDWVFILDDTDELSSMILSSEQAVALREAKKAVYSNESLNSQIREFNKLKEHYEDVQRFGKYHPDYDTVMKQIRVQKRAIDLDETIAALKIAENDYQDLLDRSMSSKIR